MYCYQRVPLARDGSFMIGAATGHGAYSVPQSLGRSPKAEGGSFLWKDPVLPLLPLWPGFALDTAFYGTLTFLLWSAPGVLRRRSRLRRGACPACGYDLRGNAGGRCPECGA
jgi:hypothetical protein